MQLRKIIIGIHILSIACLSCIKQVNVETRNEKPILVVEGNITTDTAAYKVRLTYSGQVTYADSITEQYLEKDAKVSISDNLGKTTSLVYTRQGYYETTDPAYIGEVGKSYSVTVILKDGKKYVSVPEKIKSKVPIDSLTVRYNDFFDINVPSHLDVYVNAKDPANEENYYRWTFSSWTGRRTNGIGCGFGCVMYEYCYQEFIDREIRLLPDDNINGNAINKQKVGVCYIYGYLNDFVDIGQISLTKEAFQFWQRYQDQQARTGGILDPLPAAIKGNVYNAANTDDYALGYFSASSVTRLKVVLVPFSITPYLLEISAKQFIPNGSIACVDAFPNTLPYPPPPAPQYPPPPGWENAPRIDVYW